MKLPRLRLPKAPIIVRRVKDSNMAPSLQPGWILIAKRSKRIAFGDVVLADNEGSVVVKRVIEISKKRVHLADDSHGDDGRHDACWLPTNSLIARVTWPKV